MTRVLVLRGTLAAPWDLQAWEHLPDGYEVRYLRSAVNAYATDGVALEAVPVGTRWQRLAGHAATARLAPLATAVLGDRYTDGAEEAFAWADVVHAEELSFWFAADAARRRARHSYRLVQTVWETLPFGATYRNRAARRHREEVLAGTDLFLPSTERARDALLLEGVDPDAAVVCPPGIDTARFAHRGDGVGGRGGSGATGGAAGAAAAPAEHVVLSPGRLVHEKGHQDVLRAVAALHRGLVRGADGAVLRPSVRLVGGGPEEPRLRAYAQELGLGEALTIGGVAYEDMPAVMAQASALALMSLPSAQGGLHPLDVPRVFWEEQFGLVLAEAMAAGLDIVAADSGAIGEVLGGAGRLVQPGDWMGLARALAEGPLARPPGTRVTHPAGLIETYGLPAMGRRLAAAYERVQAP